MEVGIVGAGVVGTALGLMLQEQGHRVAGVACRTGESALKAAGRLDAPALTPWEVARCAELVLITTKDNAIKSVTEEIARQGGFRPGQVVVHTSGSLTTDALEAAGREGCHLVSLHPLQSCATVEMAVENIPGSVFSIQGDEEGTKVALKLVEQLGGHPVCITREAKPLYHAAACVASNYLVSLVHLSTELLKAAGLPPEINFQALLPLIQGTLKNIAAVGTPGALTGPIARGDLDTIEEHLAVMRQEVPQLLDQYRELGTFTADLAALKGSLDKFSALKLKTLFQSARAAEEPSEPPQAVFARQ